jgi:hypothetical protein
MLYANRNHKSDIFRMAMAGSLSNMLCEVGFHFADTVNIRSKLHTQKVSTYRMLTHIFMEEGMYGLSKGISACFYGSIVCGFVYFSLFKLLKAQIYQLTGDKMPLSLLCLTSAFLAESFTLLLYYPYDTIK